MAETQETQPTAQTDDKSTSTTNTQADLIDNMNQKMQKLEQKLASLQKHVDMNQKPPTKTAVNFDNPPSLLNSLSAVETKLTAMITKQH